MALSEENSKYSRWSWNPLSQSGKSREINGGEIRSHRAGKVFNFSLTMPADIVNFLDQMETGPVAVFGCVQRL